MDKRVYYSCNNAVINCRLARLYMPAGGAKVTVPETANVRWCRCNEATGWQRQQVTAASHVTAAENHPSAPLLCPSEIVLVVFFLALSLRSSLSL